jgi:superfamily II DNA/RNA helicase
LPTPTFAELGLSAKVLAAIEATGYTTPTPIQAEAIPVALTGRDVLGIAQTGTGKTASFVLPMITRLENGRARARMPRSLILAPTRELAAQCAQSFEKYGVNHKLSVALLIGGVSMDDQVQKLDRGVDVLIATPGRLLDHFQRGRLMLMGVEILVIDEADRMLDMGFIPDIEKICKLLPPRRQTLFFSATMPGEITRLVDQFLKDPVRIEVAKPATAAQTITQRFRFCRSSEDWDKREALRELLRKLDVKNAIIFSNYKRDVAILLKSLLKHGFNAGALHGDMDQMSRMATLDKFRSGEIALLAASDVAARGLDIPDVSHVINYDVPWQPDDYIHRIGRTGRAGKEGYSVTIVTPDDIKSIDSIAKLIGTEPIWLGDPPDAETLTEGRSRKKGRGRGAKRGSESSSRRPEPRGRSRRGEGAEPMSAGRERPRRPERPRRAPELDDQRPFGSDERPSHTPVAEPARSGSERSRSTAEPSRGAAEPSRAAPERSRAAAEPSRTADEPSRAPRRSEAPSRSEAPRREREPVDARRDTARHDERPLESTREDRGSLAERVDRKRQIAREARQSEPDQRRTDGGRAVVGLGDHVPAFLRRPVRATVE